SVRNHDHAPDPGARRVGRGGGRGVPGGGAEHGFRPARLRARDRHGHAAVLEGSRRVLSLDLDEEPDARAQAARESRRGHERRPSLEQRDHRLVRDLRQALPEFAHHPAPGPVRARGARTTFRRAHRSKILTARGVFRIAPSFAIPFTASRTSRSTAWCVRMVIEASPRTPSAWNICATLTFALPRHAATWASTPGRSSTRSFR